MKSRAWRNSLILVGLFLALCFILNASAAFSASAVYWLTPSGQRSGTLSLAPGEEIRLSLTAEVPAGKVLKMYQFTVNYDDNVVSLKGAQKPAGLLFAGSVNTGTSGQIILNGLNVDGVAGPATVNLLDLTLKAEVAGTATLNLTVNNFGNSDEQFHPTPEDSVITISAGEVSSEPLVPIGPASTAWGFTSPNNLLWYTQGITALDSLTWYAPGTTSGSTSPMPLNVTNFGLLSPVYSLFNEQIGIKETNSSAAKMAKEFENLLRDDEEMIALHNYLVKKNFHPLKAADNLYKLQGTLSSDLQQLSDLKKKPKAEQESLKNTRVTYTLYLQDYANPFSSDVAAIGQVKITATSRTNKREDVYSFCLVVPDGDFENPIEYRVDESDFTVVRANSWWSCLTAKLRASCSERCKRAISGCGQQCGSSCSLTSFVRCLFKDCGFCASKAVACCGCNCRWWCRWAVGCCDR